ncbi:hypothetical protein [Agromyces bauzanensis]
MAARLPRGTRIDPVTLGYDVERANKNKWKGIADHVGISPSALFDAMVENIELDDRGYPTWLPEQPLKDGELPIAPA